MDGMLALALAILRELEAFRIVPPVLFGGVVPLLALGAGERYHDAIFFGLAGQELTP